MSFRNETSTVSLVAVVVSIVLSAAAPAAAQTVEITFEDVVERAGQRAPELLEAQARVAVADAAVDTAHAWRMNPSVSISSGPRFGADETTVDAMFGVEQPLVLGDRPAARRALAEAQRDVARHAVVDDRRAVVTTAARAFVELLYWDERVRIARSNLDLMSEIAEVASRRESAGDVGALDPSFARVAVARAENSLAQLEAHRVDAEQTVRWLTGREGTVQAVGALDAVAPLPESDTDTVRSDVALARARVEVARAQQELADLERLPGLRIGVAGGIEESSAIARGVLGFTLPLFWRGQGPRAEAIATEAVRQTAADVRAKAADWEAEAARRKVEILESAAERFRAEGLVAAERTAEIATASYRAGAIALPDLLVIRRELVQTESDFTELLLHAATARIEWLASRGAFDFELPNEQQ